MKQTNTFLWQMDIYLLTTPRRQNVATEVAEELKTVTYMLPLLVLWRNAEKKNLLHTHVHKFGSVHTHEGGEAQRSLHKSWLGVTEKVFLALSHQGIEPGSLDLNSDSLSNHWATSVILYYKAKNKTKQNQPILLDRQLCILLIKFNGKKCKQKELAQGHE